METLLYAAEIVQDKKIAIVLQGAGPVKEDLLALRGKLSLKNVYFKNPVAKSEMPQILKAVDAALVPLRKLEIFEGAIPSKIFEALSMKLPLLLGVDGEAKVHFVDKAEAALFCAPEDAQLLAKNMIKLLENPEESKAMGERGRAYVSKNFNRDIIATRLFERLSS